MDDFGIGTLFKLVKLALIILVLIIVGLVIYILLAK